MLIPTTREKGHYERNWRVGQRGRMNEGVGEERLEKFRFGNLPEKGGTPSPRRSIGIMGLGEMEVNNPWAAIS